MRSPQTPPDAVARPLTFPHTATAAAAATTTTSDSLCPTAAAAAVAAAFCDVVPFDSGSGVYGGGVVGGLTLSSIPTRRFSSASLVSCLEDEARGGGGGGGGGGGNDARRCSDVSQLGLESGVSEAPMRWYSDPSPACAAAAAAPPVTAPAPQAPSLTEAAPAVPAPAPAEAAEDGFQARLRVLEERERVVREKESVVRGMKAALQAEAAAAAEAAQQQQQAQQEQQQHLQQQQQQQQEQQQYLQQQQQHLQEAEEENAALRARVQALEAERAQSGAILEVIGTDFEAFREAATSSAEAQRACVRRLEEEKAALQAALEDALRSARGGSCDGLRAGGNAQDAAEYQLSSAGSLSPAGAAGASTIGEETAAAFTAAAGSLAARQAELETSMKLAVAEITHLVGIVHEQQQEINARGKRIRAMEAAGGGGNSSCADPVEQHYSAAVSDGADTTYHRPSSSCPLPHEPAVPNASDHSSHAAGAFLQHR